MTDSAIGFRPIGGGALTPQQWAAERQLQPPTGFFAFLGASAAEDFWGTGLGQTQAHQRVNAAVFGATEEDLAPMDQQAWRGSEHFREGVDWRPGWNRATARAHAEIFDARQARLDLIQRRNAGVGGMIAGFAAGLVGSLPTPENFIPFAGPALLAARAQRSSQALSRMAGAALAARQGSTGARIAAGAGMGAFDGLVGNAAIMPFTLPSRDQFGDDVTWAEVMQDLAFGAGAGALLGGGFGAASGLRAARRAGAAGGGQPAAPQPGADPAAPQPVSPAALAAGLEPAAAQDAALRGVVTAAEQLARGAAVDMTLAPPSVRNAYAALEAENARLRALAPVEAGDGLAARVAARPAIGVTPAAPGAEGRLTSPSGIEVGFRYEVVEAGSLVTSHTRDFAENPDFPQSLQPRDRSTPEAQQQVRDIATRLRPEDLEASSNTVTGAPLVGPDGLVESGNGRTLAVLRAYAEQMPTAQAYRGFLVRLGFDDAAAMQEPVLIRRRTSELGEADRVRLADDSNASTVKPLTPAEQAMADARRLGPEELAQLRGGALDAEGNAGFVRAFVSRLPNSEQGALSADGALTPDGLTRLSRAVAAYAYGDANLITRLTQSRDAASDALGRALMDAAPEVARLRAAVEAGQVRPELDAIPALVRAVERIQAAREAGVPLRSVFDQADMFGDDITIPERAWLDLLLRHPTRDAVGGVGREATASRIEAFASRAVEAPQQPDAFGLPPPTLGEIFAGVFRQHSLEPPASLRGLEADSYLPPDADLVAPPAMPRPAREAAHPLAARAAEYGVDLSDFGALEAELARLGDALPEDARAAIEQARADAAKVEDADGAFAAAAACAIRG